MKNTKITLTAATVPTCFTQEEWQDIIDAMQELSTEDLRALRNYLLSLKANQDHD